MRYTSLFCALAVVVFSACGQEGSTPGDGQDQASTTTVPGEGGPLGAVPVPAENPLTEAKVALGQQLFFDSRLSVDGSRSCYSCHQNENGNGGALQKAVGPGGRQLPRHSPVIWNVGYMPRFYWDGRSGSLEAQARGAWGGGNMGVGAEYLPLKAAEIGAIPGYSEQFEAVFGARGATAGTIVEAIASYERTLVCDDTRYDRFMAGEGAALTEQQQFGLELFNGKAGCATCHTPPFFSAQFATDDGMYYNVGIGVAGVPESQVDVGRMSVTESDGDWAAFKVPSLRNIAESSPYFHDGSVSDLEQAVRYMAGPGVANKNLSPLIMDRGLTDDEVRALVVFLGSLSCPAELIRPELPGG
ncbi:MAG: c-type cytochrome [Gemmatimonadetes bacterium]|nr:c-type cytochrome [Gemmatimonadota bacterium]